MAVLATETWTGSDGDGWPAQWTASDWGLDFGAVMDIQGGRGRLTPNQAAWAGGARAYLAGMAPATNTSLRVGVSTPNPDQPYIFAGVRASSYPMNADKPGEGYLVGLGEGSLFLDKVASSTLTNLGTVAGPSRPASVTTWMAVEAIGTAIRAKAWVDGTLEPDWMLTATDSAVSSGKVWLSVSQGSAPTQVFFDDLTVTDTAASGGGGGGGSVVVPPSAEPTDCSVRVGGALVPAVTRYRIGGVLVPPPPN